MNFDYMTCETNYVLKYVDSNNNYCQKECDQNCQTCDQMGNCQFCKNFYEIKNGQCVLNELQAKAIRINQEAQNNLIQQQGAKFSDGSIIVVWSSNFYEGDDFEVYGQLINNFGVKIGDNLKINTNTQGPQHSPKVLVLQDDTALIIYIDGDPKISQATIKAQKFDKQMQRIGNEFQVGIVKFEFIFKLIQFSQVFYYIQIILIKQFGIKYQNCCYPIQIKQISYSLTIQLNLIQMNHPILIIFKHKAQKMEDFLLDIYKGHSRHKI